MFDRNKLNKLKDMAKEKAEESAQKAKEKVGESDLKAKAEDSALRARGKAQDQIRGDEIHEEDVLLLLQLRCRDRTHRGEQGQGRDGEAIWGDKGGVHLDQCEAGAKSGKWSRSREDRPWEQDRHLVQGNVQE